MIARIAAYLRRTFATLHDRPRLAIALAALILAAIIISPIPPVP